MKPVSVNWGFDRGLPVDRYYIEKFLSMYSEDIRGHVLEVGDNRYTQKFGKNIQSTDVLHYQEGNPLATIVADLTKADSIPSNRFDCIVCVQTLQYIFDLRSAVETLHRILKPEGVLLTTVPAITSMGYKPWPDSWCWSLTSFSARKLFEQFFVATDLIVQEFGNLLAATSFLQGLAAEELQPEELDFCDTAYPLVVCVRAKKENAAPR